MEGAAADPPPAEGVAASGDLHAIENMLMSEYEIAEDDAAAAPASRPRSPRSPLSPAAAPEAQQAVDVTSLDAPRFEVQAWMEARRALSLDILLQQQKGLRSDIAKLKSNTQTLVHDNYSRFIAAAEIVRTMRSEFGAMAGDTGALRDKVDGATGASRAMHRRLHDYRAELSKLSELQELLEHLATVRRVPDELRELMAAGDFGSAVLLCSKTQPLLQSHGHCALLRPVVAEMSECTEGLKAQLALMLQRSDAESRAVGATVQMMRLLGSPHHELQTTFMAGRSEVMIRALNEAWSCVRAAWVVLPLHDPALPQPAQAWGAWARALDLVSHLSEHVLRVLAQATEVYRSVFEDASAAASSSSSSARARAAAVHALHSRFAPLYLGVVGHIVGVHNLLAASATAPSGRAQPTGLSSADDANTFLTIAGDFGVVDLTECLHQSMQASHQLRSLLPAELSHGVDAVVAGAVRHGLGCALGAVAQSVACQVQAAGRAQPWSAGAQQQSVQVWTQLCVALVADGARAVVEAFYRGAGHPALAQLPWSLCELVQRQLQRSLVDVAGRLTDLAHGGELARRALSVQASLGFEDSAVGETNPLIATTSSFGSSQHAGPSGVQADEAWSPLPRELPAEMPGPSQLPPRWTSHTCDQEAADGDAPAVMSLFVAAILVRLREDTVAHVMECIAMEERRLQRRHDVGGAADEPPFVAKAVQARLAKAELGLLQAFVTRSGEPIVRMLQAAIEAPAFQHLDRKDVLPPRAFCEQLRSAVAQVAHDASTVLPSGEKLPALLVSTTPSGRGATKNGAPGQDRGYQSSTFADRGYSSLDEVQGTVHSVVCVLSCRVLQAMFDRLRDARLSIGALHQCQVDLRKLLGIFSMPQTQLLCKDILAACESKCVESGAALLSDAEVERLIFKGDQGAR